MKTKHADKSRSQRACELMLKQPVSLFVMILLCASGLSAAAQIPTQQLQFDFNDTGTTTTDSVHQIILQLGNNQNNGVVAPNYPALDFHGGANSGPSGSDNCLTWASAGNGGFGGPVAYTVGNTNYAFGTISNCTISMWINLLNTSGGINPRIFFIGTNGVNASGQANSISFRGNNGMPSYVAAYNTVGTAAFNNNLLAANQWKYLAVTYTNGIWRVYNGDTNTAVAQKFTETDGFSPANLGTSFSLALGNLLTGQGRSFAGAMAHVNFYVGAANADYLEYIRESLFPLGTLTTVCAPAGTNIDFSTTGLTLATNQTLTGGGSVVGNVTNSAGSLILPGYGSTIGTLTFNNNLTLVAGGQLGYYLGSPSDIIQVNGNLSAAGVTFIAVSNIPPSGTFTVLTASGTFGATAANFQVVSNSNLAGKLVNLSVSGKNLLLTVAGTRAPASLTWVGNGAANLWDILISSNWLNGATLDTYHDGDTTGFTDSSTNQPILNTTVNPAAVNFNSTNTYSLTGSGTIAGSCSVTKSGTGALSLRTANSFSGGTLVNGGVLSIGSVSALGTPSSAIVTVTNGASFDISGKAIGNSQATPVVISGSGTATNQGALFSSVGMSDFQSVTTYGVRALKLSGDATVGNDTYIWELGTDPGGNNINGSFLDGQGHSLTKVGDNTLTLCMRNVSPLSQFVIANGGVVWANSGSGTGVSPIGASASIVISNNAWISSYNNNSGAGGGTGNIFSNNITIGAGGAQLLNIIGHLNGSGAACKDIYYGNVVLGDNLTLVDSAFFNGIYATMTFNGPISGSGSVTVSGDVGNSVTFKGNNSYTGSTTASNYVTLFTTTANQGGGTNIVVDNATLDVALGNSQPTLPVASLTLDSQLVGPGNLGFSRLTFPWSAPIINATNLIINAAATIVPPATTNYVVGEFPLVKYVSLGGSVDVTNLTLGTLPANVTAVLTNNTASQSIDLLVTSAPATLPATGTNITVQVSGSQLTLSWPASYLGWLLQSNSVALTTNAWFTVPGSDSVTQQVIQINPAQPQVFYRMVHP